MNEEWRECIPNYQVSNLGRVRRSAPGRKTYDGKVMTPKLIRIGYYVVAPTVQGSNKTFYIHDLVASAFIGQKPQGMHVNHIDGDKKNNSASNLEYVTRKGNMEHAARTGLMVHGAKHHQSKLNPISVAQLRCDRAAGISYSKLANKYGVSIATAFNAVNGKNWSHVK